LKSPYWHGHKRATFVAFLLSNFPFQSFTTLLSRKTLSFHPVHFSFHYPLFISSSPFYFIIPFSFHHPLFISSSPFHFIIPFIFHYEKKVTTIPLIDEPIGIPLIDIMGNLNKPI